MARRVTPGGIVVPGYPDFAVDFDGSQFTCNIAVEPILEPGGSVGVFYVDPVSGSDSNTGLSQVSAFASYWKAAEQPYADKIIYVAPDAQFDQQNGILNPGPGSNYPHTRLQVLPWSTGTACFTAAYRGLVWTLEDGSTYKATLPDSNGARLLDKTNLDADGDVTPATPAADLAACKATPNSWFKSGTTFYANLFDGRAPDADVLVMSGAYGVFGNSRAGSTTYLERLQFFGGSAGLSARVTTGRNTIMAKDCEFGYAINNVEINGGTLTIFEDCRTLYATSDGFNYKYFNEASEKPTAIEIDCEAVKNGNGDTDQGSSMHSGGTVIRLNCSFADNVGASIVDIHSGTLAWNLGCECGALGVSGAANVVSSSGAKMWLDTCTFAGADYDVSTEGAMLSVFNCTGSGDDAALAIKPNSTIRSYNAEGGGVPLRLTLGPPA